MVIISIIGTACRQKEKIGPALFDRMIQVTLEWIKSLGVPFEEIDLCSGGAAGADHVAVHVFLYHGREKFRSLHLYPPGDWGGSEFVGRAGAGSSLRDCSTANYYHDQFSLKLGRNTLVEISHCAQDPRVTIHPGTGFKERNTQVAQCDYMIALSWSDRDEPFATGGTRDTWDKSKASVKKHIALRQLTTANRMGSHLNQ